MPEKCAAIIEDTEKLYGEQMTVLEGNFANNAASL